MQLPRDGTTDKVCGPARSTRGGGAGGHLPSCDTRLEPHRCPQVGVSEALPVHPVNKRVLQMQRQTS